MYRALNYWVFGGFGPNKTPYEFIDFVRAQGLDGAELTVGDCLPEDISETEARKIAAYAKEKGVGLRTLATGAGWAKGLCAADAAERDEAKAFCRKYLQIAAWLGAETVLVVPGATRAAGRPSVDYAVAWKHATESLRELLPDAERLGVTIGIENVWNRFLFSPMEWKFFLDQFDSDRLGMYLDLGNCELYVPAADYVRLLGRRVKAVHVKNWKSDRLGGTALGFGEDILSGDVDFPAVLKALADVGYEGPFTAEMIPFCRGDELGIPDERLAVFTCGQLKKLGER